MKRDKTDLSYTILPTTSSEFLYYPAVSVYNMVFTVSTGWNTVSNIELTRIYSGRLAPLAHKIVFKFTPKN